MFSVRPNSEDMVGELYKLLNDNGGWIGAKDTDLTTHIAKANRDKFVVKRNPPHRFPMHSNLVMIARRELK